MFTGVQTTYIKKIIVKIAPSAKPNRFYEIHTQNSSDSVPNFTDFSRLCPVGSLLRRCRSLKSIPEVVVSVVPYTVYGRSEYQVFFFRCFIRCFIFLNPQRTGVFYKGKGRGGGLYGPPVFSATSNRKRLIFSGY